MSDEDVQPALFDDLVEEWRTDDDLAKFGAAMDLKTDLTTDELATELVAMAPGLYRKGDPQ